ncbi:MAG TPA: gamma-glutamylcyclotransferase [Candidatus Angelobacter sp.]|nr:gamma-glutamylcyclotransferase [Candidatus Angelobacter sp.]
MSEQDLIEQRRLSPPPGEDFWVFAYGSLMWNPGFPFLESHPALVRGFHRSFCVESTHYRGTKERPGLVLGLDRGGACRGRAYKVCRTQGKTVSDYLHEREMLSGIYEPRWLKATLLPAADSPMEVPPKRDAPRSPSRVVTAAAFVVDRRHPGYRRLPPERIAEQIVQGVGTTGTNVAYLENTVRHLDELGVADCPLRDLLQLVAARRGAR